MIIKEDSLLRSLPLILQPKQKLFYDAIRYCVDMIDTAHVRLMHTLEVITEPVVHAINNTESIEKSLKGELQPKPLHVAAIFTDAWSILDSIHRFGALFDRMPGNKLSAPGVQLFKRKITGVEPLRHFLQHLDLVLSKKKEQDLAVFGTLSWIYWKPGDRMPSSFILVSGTFFNQERNFINPIEHLQIGRTVHIPIGSITLEAADTKVNLCEIVDEITSIVIQLEEQLNSQFPDKESLGSDVFLAFVSKDQKS
jgi:hypothetical protein